ncbi:putative Enhancer of mRNA-decapping protein 4 [Hypsibius exemplaris]|uniref:Enhancer of mRNA-decapping protein 4 n=1 Tax=Hypsibius exemplaris TaxID=2072580 RepID=A0A1W0WA06_HYPEX|nr:putative Enhancer of mRNA-decapping protein 4 [Hypsibius exemplaris]
MFFFKVTACVKEELREQQSVMHESMVNALRSGVATPGPGQQMMASQQRTLMQDVKAALDKRQYNAAFRLALTATDLDAVLYVCEKCPLKEVFGRPDVLEMAVLFSMVQQLGVDIGSRTRLKVEYLEESLFAIGGRFEDLDHNSFKYLRRVLQDLVKLLSKFMQAHPEHEMYRNIRMIAQNAELQLRQIDAMHGGASLKQEATHD